MHPKASAIIIFKELTLSESLKPPNYIKNA